MRRKREKLSIFMLLRIDHERSFALILKKKLKRCDVYFCTSQKISNVVLRFVLSVGINVV